MLELEAIGQSAPGQPLLQLRTQPCIASFARFGPRAILDARRSARYRLGGPLPRTCSEIVEGSKWMLSRLLDPTMRHTFARSETGMWSRTGARRLGRTEVVDGTPLRDFLHTLRESVHPVVVSRLERGDY